jgi:hypothetical protein
MHDVGDRRKLSCTVRDENGTAADPTGMRFIIVDPEGVKTTLVHGTNADLVRDSVGVFHVNWDCLKPGLHLYRFEATGNVQVAEESQFRVRRPEVVP